MGVFVACFAQNLGPGSSLMAELSAAMFALELANSKGWNYFWLELDSKLVELAFSNFYLDPWPLRNRCLNCLTLTQY